MSPLPIAELENIVRAQARSFIDLFRFSTVEDLEQEARLAIMEHLHECRLDTRSAYGFFKTIIRWRLSDALRREQHLTIGVSANSMIRNARHQLEDTEDENDVQAIADASGFSILAATRFQQATCSGVVSLRCLKRTRRRRRAPIVASPLSAARMAACVTTRKCGSTASPR